MQNEKDVVEREDGSSLISSDLDPFQAVKSNFLNISPGFVARLITGIAATPVPPDLVLVVYPCPDGKPDRVIE